MTTQEQVTILAVITTTDGAGQHFTSLYAWDELEELERDGLIVIHRPVHEATGMMYSQEYYSIEVTQDGADLVRAHPECYPEEAQ